LLLRSAAAVVATQVLLMSQRIGVPAILVALLASAPPALGQLHLPRLFPPKTPAQPSAEGEKGETPSRPKLLSGMNLKLPKLNESQQKMGTEVVGGAVGGAVAGGAFGSFGGPAGTVIGAAGGALAGGVGAAAGVSFKDYARKHWKWR
jgi:hypothetical protein